MTMKAFSTRIELDRLESYQPGLSIEQIQRQYGLSRVIKLASNENSLGSSPKAKSAFKECVNNLYRYPETLSVDLRGMMAQRFQIDLSEVIVGAGSDEVIELLAKAFLRTSDEILVSAHAFMQYRIAGHLMGARVVVVPMTDLKHDLANMASLVTERTRFIFIANPNNPTGTYNTKSEVEDFLGALPDHVIPVFDEAYFEYARHKNDYPSMMDEFYRKRPMVVLRTFSKVYGLAGLRVGYGLAPDFIIRAMDKIRPPFNVSVPAQAAAQAAFNDSDFVKRSVDHTEKEKKVLIKQLFDQGFEAVPSATNFILFRIRPHTGRGLFDKLLHKGIITRNVDEYGLPDYLRVTIGTSKENKEFLKALQEVISKK